MTDTVAHHHVYSCELPRGHSLEDAVVHWEQGPGVGEHWCHKAAGSIPVPLGLHHSKPASLSPHSVRLGLSLASGLLSRMRRALCCKLPVSGVFERMYKLYIVCPAVCMHSSFTSFTHWTATTGLAGCLVFKDYFMYLGVLLASISVLCVYEWCTHIECWSSGNGSYGL